MPELKFLKNDGGEGEGLSDAGIETYRDNPFPAIARETSQNSRDAYDEKAFPEEPVRLEIEKIMIPASSLPDFDKFNEVVNRCLELAEERDNKKEIEFFSQAQDVLNADQISVLRVSDYHTRGLRGPCEEGHPFHSLVKSTGISDKLEDTSGGSFGIGKSAVYAASDLQTVFYSTLYTEEDGSIHFLSQGKTKFRSFKDIEGNAHRSIGYWGEPDGYMPVLDAKLVPGWLHREETGTTVCSIAVRDSEDWQSEMSASLISNFFHAIHDRKMEFSINGDEINDRTLSRRFDDVQTNVAANTEDFEFARQMYDCLTNEESERHSIDILGAGKFQIRLLVRDGLPKRVGILRNGMYICDNLGHFGDKFLRFSMYRDFVAIVEPVDSESNTWLRRMENPRHDEFSPERLLSPDQRKAARIAGKKLATKIREVIKKSAKSAAKQETDLEELSEFFASDSKGREDDEGSRDVKTFKVQQAPKTKRTRRSKKTSSTDPGESGEASDVNGEGEGGNDSSGSGTGDGDKGKGKNAPRKAIALLNLRTIMTDPKDPQARKIIFTPAASGQAVLEFESSGLSGPQALALEAGICQIECQKDQRQEIDVRFATGYDGPIEITSVAASDTENEDEA